MSAKTDGERLERVEASLENLEKLVSSQEVTLKEIRDNQLLATGSSASKEYVDAKISAVEVTIENSRRRSTLLNWVIGGLSLIFGGTLSLLLAFFIANVGK